MGQIKKDSCRAVYSSRHFEFLVPSSSRTRLVSRSIPDPTKQVNL